MRILFFIGRLGTGGAERQLVNLAQGLCDAGNAVCVVTIFSGGQNAKLLDAHKGVQLVSLWGTRARSVLLRSCQIALAPMLLRRCIRRNNPDFIYSMLYMTNLFAWFATRSHFSKHLTWGVRSSNMTLNWKRAVPERICAFLSRTVPLIIANSSAGMAYHKERGYHPQKFEVIPNGIDTERFQYNEEFRIKIRHELSVSLDEPLIGLVARIDPMKDHTTFLKAAALVIKEVKDVKFICVGGGPDVYAGELRVLANELGLKDRVIWLDDQSDIVPIYSALDILVSSSSYGEGFSNVIGEAMSCGVPCVVTDVGDAALIVEDVGQVVPPNDVELLAAAVLLELILNNRGNIQRNKIIEQYSLEQLFKKTEDVLCL